jgi:hypothetical protein
VPFPNPATRWRPGICPNPGGVSKGGRVVRRKARELRKATVMAEIVNADRPRFEGDGVDLLIATYKDPTVPLEVRLVCAREAAHYERSKRAPLATAEQSSSITIVSSVPRVPGDPLDADLRSLSDAELAQQIATLQAQWDALTRSEEHDGQARLGSSDG